jgi:hypothetical protein
MIHRKDFFGLQLDFANRVSMLARIPLATALLEYSNFFARFGLGRDFDPAHPRWVEYVEGLDRTASPLEWTYDFYRSTLPDIGAPGVIASVGCFSYARIAAGSIRLHFHNAEQSGESPLADHRRRQRRHELNALFDLVRSKEDPAVKVVGASWLYNLESYRRLFPPSYIASARQREPSFKGMPLWGQFLDRHGHIRQGQAEVLMQRVSTRPCIDALGACFPYPVLSLEGPAEAFCGSSG